MWHGKMGNILFSSTGVSSETGSHCIPQAGLKLIFVLFLLSEYWNLGVHHHGWLSGNTFPFYIYLLCVCVCLCVPPRNTVHIMEVREQLVGDHSLLPLCVLIGIGGSAFTC